MSSHGSGIVALAESSIAVVAAVACIAVLRLGGGSWEGVWSRGRVLGRWRPGVQGRCCVEEAALVVLRGCWPDLCACRQRPVSHLADRTSD